MRRLLALFRKPPQPTTRSIIIPHATPPTNDPDAGAAIVTQRVAIFRPPIILDEGGQPPIGMTKQLIAQYLVATTSAMADQDLGPVTVHWGTNVGRFVTTGFTVHAWGYKIDLVHPIGIVSQKLAEAWELYKDGIALKIQQMHRGHQTYDQANGKIRRAIQMLELLRDAQPPHMNPAEFLFLHACMNSALVLSALVPVEPTEAEQILGQTVEVVP